MRERLKNGRGSIAPVMDTVFFRDQSANLAECKAWLFCQPWGLDVEARERYVKPKPDRISYASLDHDRRWRWTTILMPEMITARDRKQRTLTWEEIRCLRQQREPGRTVLDCPFCGAACDNAEFVDIGVGMEQVTPFSCSECGAVQLGMNDFQEASDSEQKLGWGAGKGGDLP